MVLPSISRKTVPLPDSLCMMKPSPPKTAVPSFFWKKTSIWTPVVQARNAFFWMITGFSGVTSTARMSPGKQEAKAMMPLPLRAV